MCKSKLLSMLLTFFMFFSNLNFITHVYADTMIDSTVTAQDTAEFSVDKSKAGQVPTEDVSKKYDYLTDKEKAFQFGNNLLDFYLQNRKSCGPEWLKATDIQFNVGQNHKPVYSIETLLPWGKVRDNSTTMFWQGRYAHDSSNSSTANLGLGWRRLSQDKSNIIGLNFFYDYNFEYNLSRIGVGAENFNKLAEYRLNWYQPVSGSRQTGVSYLNNGILYEYIRAVGGLDFEAGTSFKNIPWLKFYAGGYYWNNKYNADERGGRLRTSLQISPRLTIEIGYLNSNLNSSYYGQIKYQMAASAAPAWLGSKQGKEYQNNDLSEKLYQKVERENDIKTETYTKFVAYKGNIQTTVTNSINHKPIAGASVQAYQNGTAVSNAVKTDASGNAVISALAVGTYIMHVTYGAYNVTGSSVSVTKDQTATTAVTMAVTDGLGSVNVKLAGTISAGDYKVTVTDSANDTYSATLNSSNQTATIAGIQEGNCTVAVTTPSGYTASIDPSSFNLKAGDTQAINVVSSQLTGDISINLSGTMSASDYTVTVTDSVNAVHTAKVNSTGATASLTGIPAGNCTVTVTAPDGYQASANPSSFTLTTSGQAINIVSSQLTGDISIKLSGTMSASDYTVIVTDSANAVHTAKVNSTTLAASLTGIPAGSCTVTVTAPDGYQASVNPSSFALTTSGQAVTVSSIILTTTITAKNYGGVILPGLELEFSNKGERMIATTNANGKATFSGLAAGTYEATLLDSAGNYVCSKSTFTVNDGSDTSVTVEFDIAAIAYELVNTTDYNSTFLFRLTADNVLIYPNTSITVDAHKSTLTILSGYYVAAGATCGGWWFDTCLGKSISIDNTIPSGCKYFGFFIADRGDSMYATFSW